MSAAGSSVEIEIPSITIIKMENEIDKCALGGSEYDIAKCAYQLLGVEEDKNVLSVKLSEQIATYFYERAEYWLQIASKPDAGGLTREISDEKYRRLVKISRNLKLTAFKKGVMTQYYTIVAALAGSSSS